jgi:single-stranded-DNA-specific exonuclease
MATQAARLGVPEATFTLAPYVYGEARAIASALDLAEPVAVTLVRRGYRTVEEARAFLDAEERHDPFGMDGMEEVVGRVREAIAAGRRITVHGDYDVDGVSATSILVRALRAEGARCDWYIPERLADGYGLTVEGVERLAARGTELIITVDCGITCAAEVRAARAAGIEVIVTDHHQPGEELPDCMTLHPALRGYACPDLCAAGVAFKLAEALRGAAAVKGELDLVALATVADMVPLLGENRTLVRLGLAEARRAQRPGLCALMAAARIEPERLDEGDFAFRLGPRINAAGRMRRADAGVELMLTEDPERAAAIAGDLDRCNAERREAEREVLTAAERARAELPDGLADAPGLVVAGEGWHPGVVGIVASRLAERHLRPVVLIGLDGEGGGRGSGRSVPGFDLLEGLRACEAHLKRFGGHRAAAGLEIEAGQVDAFREAFAAHVAATLGDGAPARTESVDVIVGGESLGLNVAEQFARLGPFGQGNPQVRLLVPSARVDDVRRMGEGLKHARFSIRSGPRRALGVAFGVNGELDAAAEGGAFDVSVGLEINAWNGAVEPRVILGQLYPGIARPERTDRVSRLPDAEWLERLQAALDAPLGEWPPPSLIETARGRARRSVVDRRGASGVATVASLASSGERVLVLCADARRRRELVERAASPERFGGGQLAMAAGAFADRAVDAAVEALHSAGRGVALADWNRLERDSDLPRRFEHVVVIDPAPFPHLEDLADRSRPDSGDGFLHLAWGDPEVELALRLHEAQWPLRPVLAQLYRDLSVAASEGPLRGGFLCEALAGHGAYPRLPETAARCLRVLLELGLAHWEGSGCPDALGVVSSETKDLERSEAFTVYRARCEEGRRFLTGRRQAT